METGCRLTRFCTELSSSRLTGRLFSPAGRGRGRWETVTDESAAFLHHVLFKNTKTTLKNIWNGHIGQCHELCTCIKTLYMDLLKPGKNELAKIFYRKVWIGAFVYPYFPILKALQLDMNVHCPTEYLISLDLSFKVSERISSLSA